MKEKMAADLLPTGEVPIDCLAQPNRPFTICAIHPRDRVCQGVIVKVPPTTDTPAYNSPLSPHPPVRGSIFQPPSFHLATSKLEMRLAPVEPVIGHLKDDHRMRRNYLKGRDGDRINAVLAAAGYNFSLLLRWFEELLLVLLLIICRSRSPRLLPG